MATQRSRQEPPTRIRKATKPAPDAHEAEVARIQAIIETLRATDAGDHLCQADELREVAIRLDVPFLLLWMVTRGDLVLDDIEELTGNAAAVEALIGPKRRPKAARKGDPA